MIILHDMLRMAEKKISEVSWDWLRVGALLTKTTAACVNCESGSSSHQQEDWFPGNSPWVEHLQM